MPLTRVDGLLVLMVLVWGGNFTVIKAALREFHPLAFNALRFALASLLIAFVLWVRERDLRVQRSDLARLLVLAIIGNTVYQLLFILGMDLTRASDATLILAVTPMATLLMCILLRTEKIHLYSIVGVLFSFLGVVLVVYESVGHVTADASNPLLGDLILFGCVICWSIYTVLSVPLLERYGSLKFTAYTMVLGTVFLVPAGLPPFVSQDWKLIPPEAWAGLVFSASGAIVFAYIAWYYGVQKLGNARTSVYSNLVPPFALLCAWFFLGERLGLGHFLGLGVILTGIYLTRQAPHPAAPETGV